MPILVVDDSEEYLDYMGTALRAAGHEPVLSAAPEEACRLLARDRFPLVISDLMMPGISGLGILEKARAADPLTVGIIMTAFGSIDSALDALRQGAYDYLFKPSSFEAIEASVRRALEHHELKGSLLRQAAQLETLERKFQDTAYRLEDVSRKLKSPLAAVYSYSRFLTECARPFEAEEVRKGLSIIQENAERLYGVIENLPKETV